MSSPGSLHTLSRWKETIVDLFPHPPLVTSYVKPSGLADLPEPFDPKSLLPPIRWLGDDGKNVFIEIQGSLVAVAFRRGPLSHPPPKREEVRGFSAGSRLRLFKLTNRLDFASAGRSTFLTSTWRDELGRPSPSEITLARSAFQRSIERMAETELPGIWRVEWQRRKSGRFKGEEMPHVHVIYFRAPYMKVQEVGKRWARSIGWAGRVSLRMNEITNLRHCLNYVSKYIAKMDVMSNLDIPSYLSRHAAGRKWGVYRKSLLPLCERTEIRVMPGNLVEKIRSVATEHYSKTPQDDGQGFVVFGEAAGKIQKIIDDYCLTLPGKVIS